MFLADRAVLARDGKIVAIGAAGSVKAPAGTRTIDGRGKTLVPGIWDSHLHVGDDWKRPRQRSPTASPASAAPARPSTARGRHQAPCRGHAADG
jgi:imidazolonepropionase-like amidohydrolase